MINKIIIISWKFVISLSNSLSLLASSVTFIYRIFITLADRAKWVIRVTGSKGSTYHLTIVRLVYCSGFKGLVIQRDNQGL